MHIWEDRRIFRRIEGEIGVKYNISGNRKKYYTTTKNISGGGMKICLVKRLLPGTILDLEVFRNDSNLSSKCKADIVWINRTPINNKRKKYFEAGIRFWNLNLLYIGNIINDLESQYKSTSLLNAVAN